MITNVIKVWLILTAGQVFAAQTYKFGYFDAGKPAALKLDAVTQWLRDGLKYGGVKGSVIAKGTVVSEQSTDEQLKSLDLIVIRADLKLARALAARYQDLGGKIVITDQWTREDLGLGALAVLSVALPIEKRGAPLLTWLGTTFKGDQRRGVYLTQADSDLDKIWSYEFAKLPEAKDWRWAEVSVSAADKKIDLADQPFAQNLILLNRVNAELLTRLNASTIPGRVVMAFDPWLEKPSAAVAAYFKKKVLTYYLSTYPKGLTDEARDFEKQHKEANAADVSLRDVLVLTGKALARSELRIDTGSRLFGALEGLNLKGIGGDLRIEHGQLRREIFVVEQRGDLRVLAWRSGVTK